LNSSKKDKLKKFVPQRSQTSYRFLSENKFRCFLMRCFKFSWPLYHSTCYCYHFTFLFLLIFSQNRYSFSSFKFFATQPVPGQHSIWKDVWITMDIPLPSPRLMQLQQVEFLLGIGGRPLGMVKFTKIRTYKTSFCSKCKISLMTWLDEFFLSPLWSWATCSQSFWWDDGDLMSTLILPL